MRGYIFGVRRTLVLNVCLAAIFVVGLAAQYEPALQTVGEYFAAFCCLIGVACLFSKSGDNALAAREVSVMEPEFGNIAARPEPNEANAVVGSTLVAEPVPTLTADDIEWLYNNSLHASRGAADVADLVMASPFEKLAARETVARKVESHRTYRVGMVVYPTAHHGRSSYPPVRRQVDWKSLLSLDSAADTDAAVGVPAAGDGRPLHSVH